MSAEDLLAEVEDRARAYDAAETALRAAIVEAVQGGATKVAVAEKVGVTRQTVDRWIAQSGSTPRLAVEVLPALADGCAAIAALLPANRVGWVMQRLTTRKIDSAILTLEGALKATDPDFQDKLTPDERVLLERAMQVSAEAKARHARTGTWPETVYLDPPRR